MAIGNHHDTDFPVWQTPPTLSPGAFGTAGDAQPLQGFLGFAGALDAKSFRESLNKYFQVKPGGNGLPVVQFQPSAFLAPGPAVELTGSRKSMLEQATLIVTQVKLYLNALTPLVCCPEDESVGDVKPLISNALDDLVCELGKEDGPLPQKIDLLLLQLTDVDAATATLRATKPENVNGLLGQLRRQLGLEQANVDTLGDEKVRTQFQLVVNFVEMLLLSWIGMRAEFDREGNEGLGNSIQWIHRSLLALAGATQELTSAYDSVFLFAPERASILVTTANPPVSIEEVLRWLNDLTSQRWRDVVQSGKTGIVYAFLPNAKKVQELVQALAEFAGVDTGPSTAAAGQGLFFRLPRWMRKKAPDTPKQPNDPSKQPDPRPSLPAPGPDSPSSIPGLNTHRVQQLTRKVVHFIGDVVQFATQVSISRPYATGVSVMHNEQLVGAVRTDWAQVRLEVSGRNLEGVNLAITGGDDDLVAGPIDCETTPAGTARCTISIKDALPGTYDVVLATSEGVVTRLRNALTIV